MPTMPAPGRKRGAANAASATTASPGQKRLKTETDPSRTPDQSQQQAHLHNAQQGHQLPPPPQQYHHAQHYGASHATSANLYGDHAQAVASGGGMGALDPQPSNNFAYHSQTQVQQPRYASQSYTAAPVAPSTGMPAPAMNGAIHSPYASTPIQAPSSTPQPKQTSGSSGGSQDLPPNPRIRTDGKGRDPYNIETICKQLGISTTVWDQKLRTELTKVIDRHGLAGQKVIPTNLTARESAVDEWIRNCPEWLNEPNDKYRKIYAMDRLKCGMADIRRTQNQRSKRTQRANEGNAGADEPEDSGFLETKEEPGTASPEQQIPTQRAIGSVSQETPAPMQTPVPPSATIPQFPNEQRTIAGTGPINMIGSTSPGQSIAPPLPSSQPPAPPTPYPIIYPNNPPITPVSIVLTIMESFSDRRCTAVAEDFMPGGTYSWASLAKVLREDLGFNVHTHRLYYEGPYGRVFVTSDRTLRNGISLEASRGQGYPKWEIEQ
ncbi:hypothetical protein TWF788_000999 [Orbilia oligospora]|uniref:Uncharacterized protein n=1 Tax=Orbilia oligospora TaxID=2813651 RepID=A0A7C8Q1B3_ORBOL|nr:hypothetical protein TWF788_000999 [Orbilia oligospora]KAF3211305.1 hypothetical protein TWF679_006470 [Orbilia oligospora]